MHMVRGRWRKQWFPACVLTRFLEEVPRAAWQREAHAGQSLRHLLGQQQLCEAGAALRTGKARDTWSTLFKLYF